jgi:PII-like signaling protein
MLRRGRAKKLTIYLNESSQWQGKPAYEAIVELLLAKGIAGGTVLRAIAGFTRGGGIVTQNVLRLSENLPLQLEVIETAERIDEVLPDIYLMVGQGLIELQDVEVVKYTGTEPPPRPERAPVEKVTMKAKQMWVHISEKDVHLGEPLYEAIVKRFNAEEFAGVTVYKAFEGFGSRHEIHRDRWFALHREAPMVLIMVDTEEHIAKARAILDKMLTHGAVVVTDVEATYYGPSAQGKRTDAADKNG